MTENVAHVVFSSDLPRKAATTPADTSTPAPHLDTASARDRLRSYLDSVEKDLWTTMDALDHQYEFRKVDNYALLFAFSEGIPARQAWSTILSILSLRKDWDAP